MESTFACSERVSELARRGVTIPNPWTVEIGADVNLDRISSTGVTLHPGCRIRGARTVLSSGVTLGREAPVTIEDCQLGPSVELKGGYFSRSTFLEKSSLALGAHVREACLLEEEASGAHCVGLKQTILFPFVTLGSLINFCDCLMAGGTSRKDHSEVGSSFVHFNFTPDGDKTTPSLFGDVPRGVMLNQPAIFLGGQGGAVGPLRIGFGCVTAAGSVVRADVLDDGKLVIPAPHRGGVRNYARHDYRNLRRVLTNNVGYLANLVALEHWYRDVRRPFFARQELGTLVHAGALDQLALAKQERLQRLEALVAKVPSTHPACGCQSPAGCDLHRGIEEVRAVFLTEITSDAVRRRRDDFLVAFGAEAASPRSYVETIRALSPATSRRGTLWLSGVVDALYTKVASAWKSLALPLVAPAGSVD